MLAIAVVLLGPAAGPCARRDSPAARPSAAASGQPAAVTVAEQRAVARYWTPGRMAAAVPAGVSDPAGFRQQESRVWLTGDTAGLGLRWAHGGAVSRSTGKVFFTLGRTDYVCSGSVVDSPRADVVLTAAHCVGNGAGRWAANWVFVPGYRDGTEPYGTYTARRFFVSPRWSAAGLDFTGGGLGDSATEQYDVAFVQVNHSTLYGARPHVAALPGGQPVAFAAHPPLAGAYVFGYPSEPPYSGLYPNYCAGRAAAPWDGGARIRCAMTAGDSGGPWFTGFSPRSGSGTIVAVSTFKLTDDMGVLYGTVLGPAARVLYQEASVSPGR